MIIAIIIICTRTKLAILLVRNLIIHIVLQWGNKGGEGEGEVG